jgi:hypothetical protein
MLKQTAVYWAPDVPNAYGDPSYDVPCEISVRWESRSEEFLDTEREIRMSNAVVYVASDVEVGGVLMLGVLSMDVDQSDPKNNEGAFEVQRFDKLPNLKATETLRTAYL